MTARRILVVSMNFPDDPTRKVTGANQRLGIFVDALRKLGRLEFLFYVEPRIDVSPGSVARYRAQLAAHYDADIHLTLVPRALPAARPSRWDIYGRPLLNGFRQQRYRWADGDLQRAALDAALERSPDCLFVHRLTAMAPVLGARALRPPVAFDLDDVEHLAFLRDIPQLPTSQGRGRKLYYLHVPAVWWIERRAAALAERTFVCSERDRRYLRRTMRVRGIEVIPNAVDVPEPTRLPDEPTVLFLGNLGYAPNSNAATMLIEEIWPRVRRAVPAARLTIAGPGPENVPGGSDPGLGITFPGFVDDLDALYARHRVVCAPILSGGGTRIKIIEAAGHARPIVATRLGAEGLELQDGEEIVLRDDPEAFARAVVELLDDDERADRIGRAGREVVRRTYDRTEIVGRIRREFEGMLRESDVTG